MKSTFVFSCVMVCAASGLLFAGNACAQTSGIRNVSGAIEPASAPPAAGVTAARCGTNIVVGFGDSESKVNSFDGYAVSTDSGKSFRDFGVLPVSTQDLRGFGPDRLGTGANTVFSNGSFNPSVACSDTSHFHYASIFSSDSIPCIGFPICSAITVSNSADGGKSWSLPIVVDKGSEDTHTLLSPSIAVDPSNPQRLFIAYLFWNTNQPFDVFPDCASAFLQNGIMAIKVATSVNGGATWKQTLVEDNCADQPFGSPQLIAPTIAVSAAGQVYVAYEFVPSQFVPGPVLPNEIHFARSIDHGLTFSAPEKVSIVADVNASPQLAVDRTHSPHRGEIYLTWSGKPTGTTHTEVLVSDSLNGGLSFSFPRAITPGSFSNTGRFQANPVIAVDNDGQVAACFYDTPHDQPTSTSTYMYRCASSATHAATWQLQPVATPVPVGYDAITTDFLTHHDGFFTVFEFQANGTRRVVGQFSDIN
jgi:hypothetical protein